MRHAALVTALVLAGCGAGTRRFPLAEPMWRDDDSRPFARPPASYSSYELWDFVDETVFRPVADALEVRLPRESINVNAVDEVPDSSWFQNRLGRVALTPAAIAEGGCTAPPLDPSRPWTVTAAKPDGYNPGFVIRGPDGRRYLLKSDGDRQPELPTAADTIGARIYHALGSYVPCNRIVFFHRAILRLDPAATVRDGRPDRRVTPATIDRVLRLATRLPDGRYRMSASLYVEGRPLGPFTFAGVRQDDPNDVVPHEDRRELRAARLVAAWINHWDAREGNTLTSWIPAGRGGYVRHWMLDFGDAFGSAPPLDEFAVRWGYVHALDLGQIAADLVTLGLVTRPWDRARVDGEAWIFGYFRAEDFDPERWAGIAPNPAFARMTERDAAWMARLLARFDAPLVRAAAYARSNTCCTTSSAMPTRR